MVYIRIRGPCSSWHASSVGKPELVQKFRSHAGRAQAYMPKPLKLRRDIAGGLVSNPSLQIRGQDPTVSAGIETRPTSHLDFSRTILEWLGVSPSFASEYSLGENMFRPKDHRTRVAGGWQGHALHNQDPRIFLPSPEGGRTSVYTENWERLNNPDAVLKNAQPAIQTFQEECSRFIAPALQNAPPIPPKR